jgi:DnaJ-class molecular chaperone
MVAGRPGSARIPQMPVLKRDYYEVLGVPSDADEEAIRDAFQTRAREWHPDATDDPEAEARLRELAEAYSVLSRRESRLLYDRYGFRGRRQEEAGDDLAETGVRGADVHADINLRTFEAERGGRRIINFDTAVRCIECTGRGTAKGEPCARCGGSGLVPRERQLRVLIPPGLEDGTYLRVRGEGNELPNAPEPGDLLVYVRVAPPPKDLRFVRYLAFVLLLLAVATLVLYVAR